MGAHEEVGLTSPLIFAWDFAQFCCDLFSQRFLFFFNLFPNFGLEVLLLRQEVVRLVGNVLALGLSVRECSAFRFSALFEGVWALVKLVVAWRFLHTLKDASWSEGPHLQLLETSFN